MNHILILICSGYVAFYGVWPLAEPDHTLATPMGALDLALHLIAAVIFVTVWRSRVVSAEVPTAK